MPFGGVGGSGYGRFGGKAGIDSFTELRWITIETAAGPLSDLTTRCRGKTARARSGARKSPLSVPARPACCSAICCVPAGMDAMIVERQARELCRRPHSGRRAGAHDHRPMERLGLAERLHARRPGRKRVQPGRRRAVDPDRNRRTDRQAAWSSMARPSLPATWSTPRAERGLEIIWEADDVALHDVDSDRAVGQLPQGRRRSSASTAISSPAATAFTGPSRSSIPAASFANIERSYPFGWLGILADVPPCHPRADLLEP